jgi:hypothetical protein
MSRPDATSPIETFLDDLFDGLAGTGAAGRRSLAEAEDHLRSATAEGVARGLSEDQAEREAVSRYGAADRAATALRAVHSGPARWLRPAFVGLWLAGGLGAFAVGVSGLVAELFGDLISPQFVAGDAPGVTYTPDRCADYAEYAPGAHSCSDAAAYHHWGEVVQYRVALGVLGLLALAVLALARRVTGLGRPQWRPPAGAVAIPFVAVMAAAGVAFGGTALMELTFHDTSMVGANLASGITALGFAAAGVVRLFRVRTWIRAVQ